MKCFYHKSDLDGICSGAIVRKKYPGCTMIGFDYGDQFLAEKLNPKELLILVDISLSSETMTGFLKNDIKVIWIDHHHSALQLAEEHGYSKIRGMRKVGVGACILTWQYFFESPVPESVRMLGEYDVWDHKNPDTVPFHNGLNSLGLSVYSHLWTKLFADDNLSYTIHTGKKILRYIKESTKKLADLTMYKKTWKGYTVSFINSCIIDSIFYTFLPRENLFECDFIVSYYRSKNREYRVSLRTYKDNIDVSEIAMSYGGGGHKSAAGFICETLPWIKEE